MARWRARSSSVNWYVLGLPFSLLMAYSGRFALKAVIGRTTGGFCSTTSYTQARYFPVIVQPNDIGSPLLRLVADGGQSSHRHFLKLVLCDSVLGDVLDVPIRIVVQVPQKLISIEKPMCRYNAMLCTVGV